MDKEEIEPKISESSVYGYAMSSHAKFWRGRENELELLIGQTTAEIKALEKMAADMRLPETKEEAEHIRAIWVLAGTGTYKQPITDAAGDLVYKDKPWAQSSDRARIDYGVKLSTSVRQLSGKEPFLIYNGTKTQDDDLIAAIDEGKVSITKSRLFIPEGKIGKTLDQVQNFRLPETNFEIGDTIGIVSHAPHLARLMRIINVYKPFPPEVKIKLFPIVFSDATNEAEFARSEIMGITGYVARGEAAIEPYPSEILIERQAWTKM